MAKQRRSVVLHPINIVLGCVKSRGVAIPEVQPTFFGDATNVRHLLFNSSAFLPRGLDKGTMKRSAR